ncbi:MAG: DUF4031 domain-containing protein [Chloroflexi bacterium]|nr:DUF4031 domain-containing protein [Chloroflexota bacterium]
MTVYVDELRDYPGKGRWCHMATDSDDLEELHRLASLIGLKRVWFQNKKAHPHYDLRSGKRALAVSHGAVEVTSRELVMRCSSIFKKGATLESSDEWVVEDF